MGEGFIEVMVRSRKRDRSSELCITITRAGVATTDLIPIVDPAADEPEPVADGYRFGGLHTLVDYVCSFLEPANN